MHEFDYAHSTLAQLWQRKASFVTGRQEMSVFCEEKAGLHCLFGRWFPSSNSQSEASKNY